MRRQQFSKYVGSEVDPELARGIDAMAAGVRVPAIFKSARDCGNTDERTPPYRREAHPVGSPRARLEGRYGKRYGASGVREYVEQFFAGIEEDEISRVVRHSDSAAEGLVSDEPPPLLEDNMAPLDDDADQPGRGEDRGEMPDS